MKKLILLGLFLLPFGAHASDITTQNVISITNQDRATSLKENVLLDIAAQLKAEDMARNSYFSHIDPQGRKPWYWMNLINYNYKYAGENLAYGFADTETLNTAWLNSPRHRENVKNKNFTDIGVGIATDSQGNIIVVQFFGSPD